MKNTIAAISVTLLAQISVVSGYASEVTEWSAFKRASGSLVLFKSAQSVSVQIGDFMQLKTREGDAFQVQVERSRHTRLGNYSIAGRTDSGGVFISVISPSGTVLGSLSDGYDRYRLSGDNGRISLELQDQSLEPQRMDSGAAHPELLWPPINPEMNFHDVFELPSSDKRRNAGIGLVGSKAEQEATYPIYSAEPFIDVLIYYDNELEDPAGVIDYVIEYSNSIYQFSEMGVELRVADAIPKTIDNATDNTALLEAMGEANPPFNNIASDRSVAKADLIHTIRVNKADNSEEACGIASFAVYRGFPSRGLALVTGVTEWRLPAESGEYYCGDRTFTHEIGHNLGGAHDRDSYSADVLAEGRGAYFYSYGSYLTGVYSTIMSVDDGRADNLYLTFSTPLLTCDGVPCGVSPSQSDSADNRRTLMNTKFLVTAFEGGGFDYAAVREIPWSATCEEESEEFRGVLVANNSQYTLELKSRSFLRSDGSAFFSGPFNPGQFVLETGENGAWGYCRDGEDHPIGSEVTEAFLTYENPVTGEEVEGTHIFFDDDYLGEYALVKAVASSGGSVVGNPSIHSRVDREVDLTFEPDYGFKLVDVTGTCPGVLHNNVYTVEPLYGDCWAVAKFEPLDGPELTQERFNNLLDSVLGARGG